MKKRLLSALLALALVFVLLPTTALAGVTTGSDYDISINGKKYVFSDSETCYFKSSFTTTEPSSPYLKLTKSSDTITVTVSGYVTVSDISVHNNSSTQDKINLIIKGNKGSTLNIECKDTYGAALETYQSGDITIKGGITVNANFSANNTNRNTDCHGISASKNLIITGKGTTVNAVNADHDAAAVKVGGNITVSDGAQLNATNKYYGSNNTDKAYAIKCGQLSISGENTKVTAKTSNGKQAISGTVSNGDKLTFKVQLYLASSTLYQQPMDKALKYTHVEITQAPTDPYVLIAGEPAIMDQETPIPGGTGTYLYKKTLYEGRFLTLKGVDITGTSSGPAQAIRFGENGYYTIKLEGENKISGFSSGIVAPNVSGVNDVKVVLSGSGSLDISANQYAIDMQVGNLKFENTGEIKLTTGYVFTLPLNALRVKSGSIIIDNTKYDIVGVKQDKDGTREDISDNPNLDTILKGTSTDKDLYFKSITITPAAAKPSTISYNGKTLKQGETITDRNGGTATVDRENNTITLNNFNGTALSFDATLADSTLVLEGTSTLSSIVTTQMGLTISGSGSLTVGSIKVHNQKTSSDDKPNLTITGGAHVTVGTAELTTRAIDIDGDLTVTGATLTATSNSNNVPTVQVGGDATFTGSTVTITNNSPTQGEQYKDSNAASSALHVNGAVTISGGTVTAEAKAGGNAIRAVGNITVSNDATVTAKNNSQYFNAITAGSATGGEVNTLYNLIVSGENTRITATNAHDNNLTYGGAINAYIKNANEGHYLQVGTDTKAIAPNVKTTVRNNSLTITRGDEVARTESPVVIAGTTLRNDTYYTITNGSTVAEGTENNYNAFYDSATKTLKLNNAQISHSFAYEDGGGQDGAIIFKEFENYFIELSGENTISSTNTYAINCHRPDRTLTIKNAAEAENAKLTLTSNWMVICSIGGLNIQSDVTMVNTKRADYLMYVNGTFSYTGYNAYASTEASGSPLEVYNPENYSTYKYLRVTKENLAPTTPTTYTVTITAGDNMKRESGALTQEVTKGAAITEVKFMAASGHYFPADYVSKMNLPAGLTAEIRENSWYLIISGTPTSDVTINLPAASVRPTITVSMPTPVAGYTPATASDITLTYSDINKSISKNLTISNVVWQSYVSNGDGSITPGNTLSSGDKFEAGKTYFVRITHEYVAGKYDIVPAAGITLDYTESDSTDMMLLFYTTGAPCNHEYTNDWHANGNAHWHECKLCRAHADEVAHTFGDWITDTPATDTTDGSKHRTCSVCQYKENATIPKTGTGEIVPPTPDNPGTIVIIRPAEEEKPAQQPNPSTGANDLVGLAVAAAVAAALGSAALGSAALLRKHD